MHIWKHFFKKKKKSPKFISSDAPVNKYPAIVIYNSIESNSFPFANIGFAGLIGSLTAFSSNGVAVGEKVWYPQKSMNSKKTYFGKPCKITFFL